MYNNIKIKQIMKSHSNEAVKELVEIKTLVKIKI